MSKETSKKIEAEFAEVLQNYRKSFQERWDSREEGVTSIPRLTAEQAVKIFEPVKSMNVVVRSRLDYYGEGSSIGIETQKDLHDVTIGSKLILSDKESVVQMGTLWRSSAEWIQKAISVFENNRLALVVDAYRVYQMRYSIAAHNGSSSSLNAVAFNFSDESTVFASDTQYEVALAGNRMTRVLEALADFTSINQDFPSARAMYEDTLKQFKLNALRGKPEQKTGIENALVPFKVKDSTATVIGQMREIGKRLPGNGLTPRTWGFEIEVPDAKGVQPSNTTIDKGEDGSLRSYENDDCECDCRSCSYHECNCDNCDDYNDSPDHDCGYSECQQADMAEFRSVGGIQKVRHAVMEKLVADLNEVDAEKNDTAGTHIHVFARDLTTHQVGHVIAIYKMYEELFGIICGRRNVQYAGDVQYHHISQALRNKKPMLVAHKTLAVNVMHLGPNGRGTIEFRGMDCNLDAMYMTAWAWLVRGIVTVAQRGATWNEFKNKPSLNDIVDVFAKYNYTPENENPGIVIPGSKSDMGMYKVNEFKFADRY